MIRIGHRLDRNGGGKNYIFLESKSELGHDMWNKRDQPIHLLLGLSRLFQNRTHVLKEGVINTWC